MIEGLTLYPFEIEAGDVLHGDIKRSEVLVAPKIQDDKWVVTVQDDDGEIDFPVLCGGMLYYVTRES